MLEVYKLVLFFVHLREVLSLMDFLSIACISAMERDSNRLIPIAWSLLKSRVWVEFLVLTGVVVNWQVRFAWF